MKPAQVFRSVSEATGQFGPCALAIGNFDGVHIGHQSLLGRTVAYAQSHSLRPAVLTFHPHPATVVAPERTPELICTLDQRLQLLAETGIEQILVLPFTHDIARLSPEEFVSQILVNPLQTKAVFVGRNFRFGHHQAGTAETLCDLGKQYQFVSQFVDAVGWRGEIVSSSAVRGYLTAGNVARAGRLLGRCFSLQGPVVSGEGIGSKQTVPTLNLAPAPGQLVPLGVYVTETTEPSSGRRWPSITNCGVRPTFGGHGLTIETFLLEPLTGGSPAEIEVRFRHRVRPERQFPSPAALREQILRDVARAQAYWRRARRFQGVGASIY